jgi:predicted HTH transcriptional regulator
MNDGLMEQLLHEGESSSLDYKRDQYPFASATDEDKGELLKDILAFANGWRHADGYILIGVEEVAGGRSNVVGVPSHIPENDLQQFVNSKTNRPVTFSYRAYPFEGKQIGIITVPQQDRPIYLKKNYGKLQKEVVYYRQGTTTAIATPDDIARMGSGPAKQQASLVVEFADPAQEVSLGDRISWTAEFCRMPEPNAIPTVKERQEKMSHPVL